MARWKGRIDAKGLIPIVQHGNIFANEIQTIAARRRFLFTRELALPEQQSSTLCNERSEFTGRDDATKRMC